MPELTEEYAAQMLEKYEKYTEEEMFNELMIGLLENNPEGMVDIMNEQRGEREPTNPEELNGMIAFLKAQRPTDAELDSRGNEQPLQETT